MKKICSALLLFALIGTASAAKNDPIVISWPSDKPAIRLTFDKFRQTGSYGGQNVYISDVTVLNLTEKQIPRALFNVHFMDKSNVRIGEGLLQVSDLDSGQSAKVQLQFNAVGVPVAVTLSAKRDMLTPGVKTIPLRVVSVPAGAKLKVDGQEAGMTPVLVRFAVGIHQLELTKEGYAPGGTPLDVTADELPGGSVTVELGGLSRDTMELRDGSSLLGDVISLSMTQVVMRIDGKDEAMDRNRVKKIILVERNITQGPPVVEMTPVPPHQ